MTPSHSSRSSSVHTLVEQEVFRITYLVDIAAALGATRALLVYFDR